MKPEFQHSGFFIFLLAVRLISLAGQTPAGILTELLWETPDLAARCAAPQDTAVSSTRIFISGSYDDLYNSVVTGSDSSHAVLDKTALFFPQGRAGIVCNRKSWGAFAGVRTGMIEAHWRGRERDYIVDGKALFNNLSLAGWIGNRRGRVAAGLGYDFGLPFDYRGSGNSLFTGTMDAIFNDPHIVHFLGATLFVRNISLTLYESKRPLLTASVRIERQSNGAFVEIPLAASEQEIGAQAEIASGRNRCFFGGALVNMASDTALSGENLLSASLAGQGERCGFRISLGDVRFMPAAEINCLSLPVKIRGYDYSDTVPFGWLDSNRVLFIKGQVSASIPWNVRAGLFGEHFKGGNNMFGRFDPYLFSPFSIFDPVKYRIDTVDIKYSAAGIFLERSFGLFRRDSIGAALGVSYIRTSGSIDTREYDFTYLIPRLINPRTMTLVDEKLILLVPEVRYTFLLRRFSCTAAVRQLVPISLKSGGGGVPSGPPVSRSIRGGTTVSVEAEYRW